MEFLFKLLDNKDKTKITTDSISCDKYKFNSCPKEFIDFLSPIYAAAIRGIEQGETSLTRSVLSDFQDKARTNGMSQALIHTVYLSILVITLSIAVLSFANYGAFLPDGSTNTPTSLLIAFGMFGYLSAVVFFHFYWYGQVDGMKVEKSTAFVVSWIVPTFIKWYVAIMSIVLFFVFIFINIPSGFNAILLAMTNNILEHSTVWKPILNSTFLPDIESVQSFSESLKNSNMKNFSYIANTIFISSIGYVYFLANKGYNKGKEHTEIMTKQEKETVQRKLEYKFDKAIRMLRESGA